MKIWGTNMQQLDNMRIGFIGGGNMAQALIGGLLGYGVKASKIWVADPLPNIATALGNKGIKTTTDNTEVINNADVIILAVKPQVMAEVLKPLQDLWQEQIIISIAAGVGLTNLQTMLAGYGKIVRAMPNTPALVQTGATGLYAETHSLSVEEKDLVTKVMGASGLVLWLDNEDLMHAVTAVSGSAPAYFFYFIESIIKGGVALGLTEKQAATLAMQTALGAAQMAITSDDNPATLRQKVTSPNGTTQAAIDSMQHHQVAQHIVSAMQACAKRSRELSA